MRNLLLISFSILPKKKFIICGKKEKYHDLQGELMKRLILK